MDVQQNDRYICPLYFLYLMIGPFLLGNGINITVLSNGQSLVGIILLCLSIPPTSIIGILIMKKTCSYIRTPQLDVPPVIIINPQPQLEYVYVNNVPGTECILCAENPRTIAYIPCGHTVCISCDEKLIDKPCSFCRALIHDRLKLY